MPALNLQGGYPFLAKLSNLGVLRVVQKQSKHDQEDHESYEQVPIKMQFRLASFRRYTETRRACVASDR